MRFEVRAKSRSVGHLSTIAVFTLMPLSADTNPVPVSTGLPDGLGSGDALSRSKRSKKSSVTREQSDDAALNAGDAVYVIRRVKVYFQDQEMAELRPATQYRPPPRVSSKHASVQIEGLPLER